MRNHIIPSLPLAASPSLLPPSSFCGWGQPRFLRLLDSPFPYVFGLPVSTTAAAARVDPLVQDILRQREVLLEEAEGDVVWIDLEQGEFLPETEPLPPPHIFRDLFCFLADAAARRGSAAVGAGSVGAAAQLRNDCEHLRWRFAHGLAKIVFGYDRHLDRLKVGRARRFLAQKLAALNELQQHAIGIAAAGSRGGGAGARPFPSAAGAGPTSTGPAGWSPSSPGLFDHDDSSGDDADDDAPIPGFDNDNSFHRLLRAVSEAQDFQMFALKKAALYAAEVEASKEGKVANSPEWEAFDWLCAYEERRARDHLR